MLTWLLASRGTNRLATLYLAVAGVALLVAASTWVLVTAQHNAAARLASSIDTCEITFPRLMRFLSPSKGTQPDTYAVVPSITTGR